MLRLKCLKLFVDRYCCLSIRFQSQVNDSQLEMSGGVISQMITKKLTEVFKVTFHSLFGIRI